MRQIFIPTNDLALRTSIKAHNKADRVAKAKAKQKAANVTVPRGTSVDSFAGRTGDGRRRDY